MLVYRLCSGRHLVNFFCDFLFYANKKSQKKIITIHKIPQNTPTTAQHRRLAGGRKATPRMTSAGEKRTRKWQIFGQKTYFHKCSRRVRRFHSSCSRLGNFWQHMSNSKKAVFDVRYRSNTVAAFHAFRLVMDQVGSLLQWCTAS